MFRRPGNTGRSKASTDTLCQKCLKRGHYSYECTVSAQERPYRSRPSRTQQLLNPQLKPKLTTEVPNDLMRKKGVADEILAKKEGERGRRSGRDSSRKRSRSASYSSDSESVSTISTNRSRSPSPLPKRVENGEPSLRGGNMQRKRARRSVSSASDSEPEHAERSTRRRMSSFSPAERGRRRSRSRSRSSRMDVSHEDNWRREGAHKSRSRSRGFNVRRGAHPSRSRSREVYNKRAAHPVSRSPNRMDTSEDTRVAHNDTQTKWEASRMAQGRQAFRSRSRSPFRPASPEPYNRRRAPRSPIAHNTGGRNRFDTGPVPAARNGPPPAPLRERSLSPYSKRVALTRQNQTGR